MLINKLSKVILYIFPALTNQALSAVFKFKNKNSHKLDVLQ